jgi:hypothetical protein
MQLSTSPLSLLPTSVESSAVGEAYQGREFHFILAFSMGKEIARYPFSFRITSVDVESPAKRLVLGTTMMYRLCHRGFATCSDTDLS